MAESEASTEQNEPPKLVVQHFSLHHIMMANNSQILGEMSVVYGAYKHSGSRLDMSTLLDLYNGGSWSRNFRNKEQAMVEMQQTANMCGFIQPAFILNMLNMLDTSDPNDRQFFICLEEVQYIRGSSVHIKTKWQPTHLIMPHRLLLFKGTTTRKIQIPEVFPKYLEQG